MSSGDSIVSTDLGINMGSSVVKLDEDPVEGNVSFDICLKTTLLQSAPEALLVADADTFVVGPCGKMAW